MPSLNFAELAKEAKKSSFKFEGEENTCSFLRGLLVWFLLRIL